MPVERCVACEGRKFCMGLGGMRKECSTCKGVGFIKLIEIKAPVAARKKPGPKPKDKSCQKASKEKSLLEGQRSTPLN